MANENEDEDEKNLADDQNDDNKSKEDEERKSLREEHAELLERMVDEKLSVMKENLDKAYKKLEEQTKENTRLKSEAQEGKRKRLEDEGKHLEAANLRLAELEEKLRLQTETNTRLTRDREVEKALGTLDFRNEFAKETAVNIIKSELVQDSEDGTWIHKSGASLSDFIKTFVKDPNKDFLFKPKETNGAGTTPSGATTKNKQRPSSLKGMSSEELIQLAKDGKLGSFGM